MKKWPLVYLLVLFNSYFFRAQNSPQYNSAEILQGLKKLNTVGSVLYVAAHPDDENTRLLSYLAKERNLRTGYLSITRGDGGQNLIGKEQGELLGLIRTQELLAARRIDGAEQFFTRANDFGYSKNPEETYSMPGYAKAVRSVIDQLQLQDFILVGHSLGGHIAINVAGSEKNTKGLLLFGTPPLDVVSSFGNAFLPNPLFPLLLQSDVTENQALQLAEDILLQQEQKENLIKDILNTDPNARAHFAAFVGNGVIEDEIKMINSFYFPTAILHGEKDTIANKEYIENIGFQNLWNNKLHIINNSGHCPQIEQHQTFNDLLNDYYKSVV